MVMAMTLMMGLAENQGADQVDGQTETSHDDGLQILNRLGSQDALQRTEHHHQGHAEEEDGAGKATQDLDFPSPEGKTGVTGELPGAGIGHGG